MRDRPYARRVCTAARWKIESASPREEEVSLTAEGGRSQCARCLPTFKLRFGGKVAALRPRARRLGSFARSPSPPFPFHLLEPGLRSPSGSPRHLRHRRVRFLSGIVTSSRAARCDWGVSSFAHRFRFGYEICYVRPRRSLRFSDSILFL